MALWEKVSVLWQKASLGRIVGSHWKSFHDADTKEPLRGERFVFFGLPAILGALLVGTGVRLSTDAINLLAATMSIFAALLFALLVPVIDLARKTRETPIPTDDPTAAKRIKERHEVLKELHHAIGFAIVLAVISLALLLCLIVPSPKVIPAEYFVWPRLILDALILALVVMFLLDLLVILKRFYILSEDEFKPKPPNGA